MWTCRCIAASFVGGHARGSALTPSASIRPIVQSARERSGLSSRSGHRPLTPTPRSLICRPSEIARTNARCGGEHVRARRHAGARGGYPVPGRGRALTGRPARPPTSSFRRSCNSDVRKRRRTSEPRFASMRERAWLRSRIPRLNRGPDLLRVCSAHRGSSEIREHCANGSALLGHECEQQMLGANHTAQLRFGGGEFRSW